MHVNITFDQFDGFVPLTTAILSLQSIGPAAGGTNLEKLFNTTFTKTPEVFLMFKKEINASYPDGFKVPTGHLGGVKKIAVTFGKKSNIRDISDFNVVIHAADSVEFSDNPIIAKVTEALCYGKSIF